MNTPTDTRPEISVSLWNRGAYDVRRRDPRGRTPLIGRVRIIPEIGGPVRGFTAEDPDGREIETFDTKTDAIAAIIAAAPDTQETR